jgi:outer membrane lipoprotein SlyB
MHIKKFLTAFLILSIVSGCARDLSSNVYTSDSSLNLTLIGEIVAARPIIIKNHDELSDNTGGMVAGGVAGAALASVAGSGSSNMGAIIAGGVLAGVLVGALVESSLSKADGIEYVVQIDRSTLNDGYYEGSSIMRNAISSARITGLITVVQGKDNLMSKGEKVYVILSPKRARLIAR